MCVRACIFVYLHAVTMAGMYRDLAGRSGFRSVGFRQRPSWHALCVSRPFGETQAQQVLAVRTLS